MRGLYLDQRGLSYRDDLEAPKPPPGHALVRVSQAGICSTDLQLVSGLYGFQGIPGHEFVGVVEEVAANDSDNAVWSGERVVGNINIACGTCDLCRCGMRKHCRNRHVLGIREHSGAFADYLTLPVENLYPVPANLSLDSAVLAEPLAAALDILDRVKFTDTALVAVVGDGRLAQLVVRVLLETVSRVVVIGRHPEKLQRLPQGTASYLSIPSQLRNSCDVVVECSGSATGIDSALRLIRPCGTIVMKSTVDRPLTLASEEIVVNELTLVGSRCGNLERALDFLSAAQKKDQALANLVDAHFMIEEGLEAFAYVSEQPAIKVVLNMT